MPSPDQERRNSVIGKLLLIGGLGVAAMLSFKGALINNEKPYFADALGVAILMVAFWPRRRSI